MLSLPELSDSPYSLARLDLLERALEKLMVRSARRWGGNGLVSEN